MILCENCSPRKGCTAEKDRTECKYYQPMTNEEWFCGLSTAEKAKWLYDHYVNARAEEFYGRPEKTLYDYQKWLVDAHKGIDGTRVG